MVNFKQLLSPQNSKRLLIKFLLSFSLFCVSFSLLFQSLKPFLIKQFISHVIEKGCMFLLFNGLLAFIAIYSSRLINASSSGTHGDESMMEYAAVDNEKLSICRLLEYNNVSESEIAAAPFAGENVMETDQSPKEKEEKSLMIYFEEPETVLSDAQEDDDEEEERNALMIIDDADETEELNKKCEDFIKKMKAAIYSESIADYYYYFDNQRSLAAVN